MEILQEIHNLSGKINLRKSVKSIRHLFSRSIAALMFLSVLAALWQPMGLPQRTARAAADSTTFYVTPGGNDAPGCGTATSPCRSIQYTVDRAASGDVILVAEGVYTYSNQTDPCDFLTTRAVVCFVDKHLTILGGYAAGNWTAADPASHPTIIDGQGNWRGVAIIAYNTTASLRMEGFTIQDGVARGKSSGDDFYTFAFGGGMWGQNSSVTLRDMVFKNNRSIGGNTSTQYGGAGSGGGLAIQSPKNRELSTLERVTFEGNQALGGSGAVRGGVALGGGLYTYEAPINGTDLVFTNNLAQAGSSSGSGKDSVPGVGLNADALGGAAAFQSNSTATLQRVTATGNQALGGNAGTASGAQGGGAFGGAISAESSSLTTNQLLLRGNRAQGGSANTGGFAFGGGLITDGADSVIDRIQVLENEAVSGGSSTGGVAGAPGGGGLYLVAFRPDRTYHAKVTNAIIADNRIEVGPGTSPGGGGGGVTIQAMTAELIHTTIVNNNFAGYLKAGQAVLVNGLYGDSGTPASLDMRYSIIANHVTSTPWTSAFTVAEGSSANLYQGIFSGNSNDSNFYNPYPYPAGNITGMETMGQEDSLDFVAPGSPSYDYHLTSTSPAIDQAVNSNISDDIDGEARTAYGVADIGADEYSLPELLVSPESINVMLDDASTLERTAKVDFISGSPSTWTATTSASWLYLGVQGTAQEATGQTGDYLTIRFAPDKVSLGYHTTTISLTTPEGATQNIQVTMIKVAQVYTTYIPVTLH